MSLNAKTLRAALLGAAVAGALGFGGQQAFAAPHARARLRACTATGENYQSYSCGIGCPWGQGYCDLNGFCHCGPLP